MSTPNPLAPQGSLLEQHGRGRSTFQIISFIGGLHVVFLCGLLWIGCKKEETPQAGGGLTGTGDDLPPVTQGTDPAIPPANLNPVAVPSPGASAVPPVEAFPGALSAPAAAVPSPTGGVGLVTPAPEVVPPMPLAGAAAPAGAVGAPGVAPGAYAAIAPATGPATTTHKVGKGEYGVTIARKHGVTLKALQDANPTVNWNRLKVDQELVIPAAGPAPELAAAAGGGAAPMASGGGAYVVQGGDTGLRISRKFGVPWKDIRRANNLSSDTLRIGQQLTIPGAAAPAAAPAAGLAPSPSAVPLPPQ